MGKETVLHELLAVEQGLAETANRVQGGTTKTLETKRSLFEGMTKAHEVFDEDAQHLKQATEIKEVQDTVDGQLDFLNVEIARYWDVILQKEEANQRAKADIVVDGQVLATDVPSIVLLSLEKKLASLVATYNAIPTLDASKAWEVDPNYDKHGVFRTKHDTERQHTRVVKDWIEVSPATKEHKAQIVQDEKTEVIGKYIISEFSGAISSLDKAERIQRLMKLSRAVKSARQRANNTVVNTDLKFGKPLLDYINGK